MIEKRMGIVRDANRRSDKGFPVLVVADRIGMNAEL